MPDYFSHAICAQIIYERCPSAVRKSIDDFTLYMLGAQGGDIFFAYKLNYAKNNPGRKLHLKQAATLFKELSRGNLSYCAGFATHYALDCTLHPAIYAYEETTKAPFSHMRFESDLGLFISRKYATPRKILPRERVLAATFSIYDSISKIDSSVTVTGIERCLKRHFAYTRTLIRGKKQKYSIDYDFASLSGVIEDGISLGVDCVSSVISGNISEELFSRSFLER